MKAAMLATDMLTLGTNRIMVTGGMESMSNAPYLLPKARGGLRLGHGEVKDHMFLDGLEDAYDPGRLMGTYAEDTAAKYGYTREAQDRYAITSLTRAQDAIRSGTLQARDRRRSRRARRTSRTTSSRSKRISSASRS